MEEKEFNYKTAIIVALVFIVFMVGFSMTRNASRDRRPGSARIAEGNMAPDFTLPGLDGKMVRLREKRGKVIFLNIWASWCPPCIEEMPSIQKLHKVFEGEKFEILAVSIDEAGAEAVAPFMKNHGLTFPVLIDPKSSIQYAYGTTGVPESFVIDKNGVLLMKFKGPADWATPDALRYFRELIQRPMMDAPETKK